MWLSLVARFVRDEEVVGSNPATPTHEERDSGFFGVTLFMRRALARIWEAVATRRPTVPATRMAEDLGGGRHQATNGSRHPDCGCISGVR